MVDVPVDMQPAGNDPFDLFHRWLAEAAAAGIAEPTAAVVATVDADDSPDARFVLVREVDSDGFVFYTNLRSAKSRQLIREPRAALVFGWLALQRSVRVRGVCTMVGDERADAYWEGRPRGSQISAWASPQSDAIADRALLEGHVAEIDARHAGTPVPRPEFWGGWKLTASSIEFWHGRPNRLHDRIIWRRDRATGEWQPARLAP